mmetsp:Transcript_31503/g.69813  ORF Transcript_31503/g.69813 Transcript_31503/m.69813 type:complete len:1001 (+) Transcript_31503:383-3385(+)
MPSLLLYDRRTLLAGDDLQIPSLLTILVRLFQLTFLLLPIWLHIGRESGRHGGLWSWITVDPAATSGNAADGSSCHNAHVFPLLLSIYALSTTLYTLGTIYLESLLYRKSGIGTPTQPELRYNTRPSVAKLVESKIGPAAMCNAMIWLLGVVALSYSGLYYTCTSDANNGNGSNGDAVDDDDAIHHDLLPALHPHLWWYALILILLTQFAELCISAVALARLLSLPKRVYDGVGLMVDSDTTASLSPRGGDGGGDILVPSRAYYVAQHHHRHQHHELVEEMWHDRCTLFCRCLSVSTCFLFGGRDVDGGDYTAVARALADYFEGGGVLDLVPSDIVAGFVMLQRVQRQRVLEARREVIESSRRTNPEDALEEGMQISSTTISSLRDSAVKRSAHDRIFPTGSADLATSNSSGNLNHRSASSLHSSGGSSAAAAAVAVSPTLSRTSSATSFSPMPDPSTPAPPAPDRSTSLSDNFHPSALAFRMEHTDTRTWYETTRRSVLCRNDETDRAAIAEGARFSRHALAIYTWVLYVYMHPIKGPCKLACAPCMGRTKGRSQSQRRGGLRQRGSPSSDAGLLDETDDSDEEYSYSSCPTDDGRIIGDNCCHAHRAALLAHAGLDDSDLIYAQLNSSFKETPYCIVVDHRWKSVVLSIRGTLSIEDCVVDVLVDPEGLEELGNEHGFDAKGQACHSGVLAETRWLLSDLKQHRILDRLLVGPNAEYPHYNLRIVGHSLGAACSVLLSYMLKRNFPNLRCTCISPPGGFLTWKMATECKDFVTSFVLDSDIVPRLSVDSMEHLRNEILQLFGRIKVPKAEVLEHAISGALPCMSSRSEEDLDVLVANNAQLLHPPGSILPDTEYARQLERVKEIQSERRKSRAGLRDIPLYPPGRICHLVKTGEKKQCGHGMRKCLTCFTTNIGSEYTAVWIENDDLNEIVVSPTLWTDHFPDRVCLEIEGVATNFGIDTSLGSSASDRENALLQTTSSSGPGGIEGNARLVSDTIFP